MRPIARFVAERGGTEAASMVFGRGEIFEREPAEYALARLSWAGDRLDAACAVMTSAARSAPPGAAVYFMVNSAANADHAGRRGIAEACGFRLFQEKEGFWWADTGGSLPEPAGVRLRPMSRIGRGPFVPVIGRCLTGTLDRTDARRPLWCGRQNGANFAGAGASQGASRAPERTLHTL